MNDTVPVSETKYLRFERQEIKGRKTPLVLVRSRNLGIALGIIKWFGRWRQFCFFPQPGTVFNTECMQDIQEKIGELHSEREARA